MQSLKMVLVSDIHYSEDRDFSTSNWRYMPSSETKNLLHDFVTVVNNDLKPDVVVELGDRLKNIDYNCDLNNTKYIKGLLDDQLSCACYHVNGNHDFVNLTKQELSLATGCPMLPYVKQVNGYDLIFLDTLDPMIPGGGGSISFSQLQWLEKKLKENENPKLVFSHHPLNHHRIDKNSFIRSSIVPLMYVQDAQALKDMMENSKTFVGHFSAHMHMSSIKDKYVVCPSLGSSYPDTDHAPGFFMEVEVKEDRSFDCTVFSLHPVRVIATFSS